MVEEGTTSNEMCSKLRSYMNEVPFFCKIIELILCIVAIGLIIGPYNNNMQDDMGHAAIVYIAIGSFILINGVVVFSYLVGEKMPKKMSVIFSSLGAVLCLVAGAVLIHDWDNFHSNYISRYLQQYLDQMIASGIFAILAAATFVVDTYLTNKSEH